MNWPWIKSEEDKELKKLKGFEKIVKKLVNANNEVPIEGGKAFGMNAEKLRDKLFSYSCEPSITKGFLRFDRRRVKTNVLDPLRNEIRELEHHGLINKGNNTQRIVAIFMFLTVAAAFGSLFITNEQYKLTLESRKPRIVLTAGCPPFVNGSLKVTASFENIGFEPASIMGEWKSDIVLEDAQLDGVLVRGGYIGNLYRPPSIKVSGNGENLLEINIDTRELTVSNFNVDFNFTCTGYMHECIIVGGNQFSCPYVKMGDLYVISGGSCYPLSF